MKYRSQFAAKRAPRDTFGITR